MANPSWNERDARATAHVGYALIHALLAELEKDRPGLRKKVWQEAERSLREYDLLDDDTADWLRSKVAEL